MLWVSIKKNMKLWSYWWINYIWFSEKWCNERFVFDASERNGFFRIPQKKPLPVWLLSSCPMCAWFDAYRKDPSRAFHITSGNRTAKFKARRREAISTAKTKSHKKRARMCGAVKPLFVLPFYFLWHSIVRSNYRRVWSKVWFLSN